MIKRSRFSLTLIVILLFTVITSQLVITPVRAQDPTTTLSITSTTPDICVGSELTLKVYVSNVMDLYGYDISLNFDPDVIEVLNISNSGWLTGASQVYKTINNTTGFLELAFTKLTAVPGISGSGNLMDIRVRVKAPAETIQFTFITTGTYPTTLSNSLRQQIPYSVGSGGNTLTHACELHFPETSRITCVRTTIPVRIEDIFNLYAYDLRISYDPAVIQIHDVTFDNSFIEIAVYPIIDFSTPGTISVFGSKESPAPPSTGSGVLINIEVDQLISDRDSGLRIEATSEFSDQNGFIIPINITNKAIWTYPCDPNAVELMSFDVVRKRLKAFLSWETAIELNNVGFNIYRSGFVDGTLKKVNKELIPAKEVGSLSGAQYQYLNTPLKPWKTYYYWLESVDLNGETSLTGPIKAAPPKK
jgi:hypothetical protein